MKKKGLGFLLFLLLIFSVLLPAQDVLRGEVKIELEPIYGGFIEDNYPLETEEIYRRALEMAALFFSAQIYGWSFHYDIGERARGIDEEFTLTPMGQIHWGDPRLRVTHTDVHEFIFSAWMDYRPSDHQRNRIDMWRMGSIRTAQAIGYGPFGNPMENPNDIITWLSIRQAALEDAARAAIRAMLQGSERNRPKEANGFISLQNFPIFWVDGARWAANARFRVDIREIIPFAAY